MSKPAIICVDDQREILATLQKDLSDLEPYFQIEYCESAEEAKELLTQFDAEGKRTVLIISDHVMPEQSGVDFLIELNTDHRFTNIPSMLLTGLATHQDTITAINEAGIQAYIEKPWDKETLLNKAKRLYTQAILRAGIDYQPFIPVLDQEILLRELRMQT